MAQSSHTNDGESTLNDYIIRLSEWGTKHADMVDCHGKPMYEDEDVVIYGTLHRRYHREYNREGVDYREWARAMEALAARYIDHWHLSQAFAIVTYNE